MAQVVTALQETVLINKLFEMFKDISGLKMGWNGKRAHAVAACLIVYRDAIYVTCRNRDVDVWYITSPSWQ